MPSEESMSTITPEQRREIEQAGGEPVRVTDPETNDAYYLLKAEVFERIRDVIQSGSVAGQVVPEGILRSKAAFLRDLPRLLENKKLARQWVAYHGEERIGVARTERELIQECLRRGLKQDEYYVDMVIPHSPEPEEIEGGGPYEFEEFIPHPQP
jgi:hypothetical protein